MNIEVDDGLVAEAMAVTGLPTQEATIKQALRRVVSRHRRLDALTNLAGLGWDGDLDAARKDRVPDQAP